MNFERIEASKTHHCSYQGDLQGSSESILSAFGAPEFSDDDNIRKWHLKMFVSENIHIISTITQYSQKTGGSSTSSLRVDGIDQGSLYAINDYLKIANQ